MKPQVSSYNDSLKFRALYLVTLAVGHPVISALLLQSNFETLRPLVLHPLNFASVITAGAAAWSIWKMRALSKYTFIVSAVLIVVNAYFVAFKLAGNEVGRAWGTAAAAAAITILYLIRRRIRSQPRYGRAFKVSFAPEDWVTPTTGTTEDVNTNGCLIRVDPEYSTLKINPGDDLIVTIQVFTRSVRCEARVVRLIKSAVGDITTFGVRFSKISRGDKKIIRTAITLSQKKLSEKG